MPQRLTVRPGAPFPEALQFPSGDSLMLPGFSDRGNRWATVVICVLGLVSIVVGVLDLWPASAINRAAADLLGGRQYFKGIGILALFAASFATGFTVGFIHDRLFGDDDQDTPRPRRRRPTRE